MAERDLYALLKVDGKSTEWGVVVHRQVARESGPDVVYWQEVGTLKLDYPAAQAVVDRLNAPDPRPRARSQAPA